MRVVMGLLATVVLAVMAITAEAQVCPPDQKGPPIVRVTTQIPETEFVFDRSKVEITALAREKKNPSTVSSSHDSSVGLTKAGAYQLKVTASVAFSKRPDGTICFYIREVNATWAIPTMVVFIANNYSPSSCEYAVIMEHENQHVSIHKKVLLDFKGPIENELRRAALSISPYIGKEQSESQRAPKMLVDQARNLMAAVDQERIRANGEIDTPENYRRTRLRCRNW